MLSGRQLHTTLLATEVGPRSRITHIYTRDTYPYMARELQVVWCRGCLAVEYPRIPLRLSLRTMPSLPSYLHAATRDVSRTGLLSPTRTPTDMPLEIDPHLTI